MELVLALVTDLHFGPEASFGGKLRKLTGEAPELARAFVERMNEVVRPDLVVNLGDDIEDEGLEADRARYQACVDVLRGARAELFHVAGNHDLVHLREDDLLAAWRRPELTRLHYSFDRGGYHFAVLHTRERKDIDVRVGDDQIRWLAADLAAARAPTVILMHHSAADQDLRGNRWFEGSPHICLVDERRELRALFRRHGVVAVFNGHLHWNHLDVIDGIPYVTLQSLIENLDDDAPGRAAAAHAVVRL
ncbi:MAG TPA: metallophosphoesterase, partial [Candidatus Nanopelagicales bacterium]|nr:metallophosphoesterase [Candidatus Nanopelagicales bacterium]